MTGGGPITAASPPRRARRDRDHRLAAFAARQHGVITLAQAREAGLSPRAVRDRVAMGRLHRIHRGVYAVGHPRLCPEGHWMAAVLACGEGSILSHRAAAAHWGVRSSAATRIDVTSPSRAGRSRSGIAVHRADRLAAADVTMLDRIPCTTVARTLIDLAGVISAEALEYAVHRAQVRGILDIVALRQALDRSPTRRGSGVLRRIIGDPRSDQHRLKSKPERRFLAICKKAGLPMPRVNHWIAVDGRGLEVDFAWSDRKLAVEIDSETHHDTYRARENDPQRDRLLTLAGWRVVRYTRRQLAERSAEVGEEVRRLRRMDSEAAASPGRAR